MKIFRHIMVLLSIITLTATVALPASAAVDATTRSKMQSFPHLYNGVDDRDSVRALQKFLINCNVATDEIKQDGLDGGFGDHVEAAVRLYQVSRGIGEPGEDPNHPDGTGEVASITWGAIADDLFIRNGTQALKILHIANDDDALKIYRASINSSQYSFYYYNEYDNPQFWLTR